MPGQTIDSFVKAVQSAEYADFQIEMLLFDLFEAHRGNLEILCAALNELRQHRPVLAEKIRGYIMETIRSRLNPQ